MSNNADIRLVDLDEQGVDRAFRADVLAGLSQEQKAIPARWFYDDIGSRLFEEITQLPEYYPTRAETQILSARGDEILDGVGQGRAVVEIGSGSSVKTPLLLKAIAPSAYVPIDIAGDFLRSSSAQLASKFPGLSVHPVEADFTKPVTLPDAVEDLPKLGFFSGSTIGNMAAGTSVDLLRTMRESLGTSSMLLIGMDLIKDRETLISAYDDKAGTTARFNLNLLERINRELSGTIVADKFAHVAIWNDVFARIEMHLEARDDVEFSVSGQPFSMKKHETIHTENSHKFGHRSQNLLLSAGGWTPQERWVDEENRYSLVLASASNLSNAP